ncbi:hypothetical protein PENTCL1PPCAC_764, partial [Pristionchus entomophagus]
PLPHSNASHWQQRRGLHVCRCLINCISPTGELFRSSRQSLLCLLPLLPSHHLNQCDNRLLPGSVLPAPPIHDDGQGGDGGVLLPSCEIR